MKSLKNASNSETRVEFVDRIRAIFSLRELTLAKISSLSAQRFGRGSEYFVPHNIFTSLLQPGFAPRLQQICALSEITRFSLRDWLLAFGFDLEHILQLQMIMPARRTLLLDSRLLRNARSWVTSIIPSPDAPRSGMVLPFTQLVRPMRQRRLAAITEAARNAFIIKIGQLDTFAYPEICPGSLVFASPVAKDWLAELEVGRTSALLYLIKYAGRVFCCRLHRSKKDRVVLVSKELAYPHLEISIRGDLRVLATLRYEVRVLSYLGRPDVPGNFSTEPEPEAIRTSPHFGEQVRTARMRLGLSLREVSRRSQQISEFLADPSYFITPGSLSDYETSDLIPRRTQKLFTFSILYGVPFSSFLEQLGFDNDLDHGESIPDELVKRRVPGGLLSPSRPKSKINNSLWIDPLLMHSVIPTLLDLAGGPALGTLKAGLQDLFWVARSADRVSPHLLNGDVAVLNRFRKRPFFCRTKPAWQQPLFVILHRDGNYECACCSRSDGKLVVRTCFADVQPPRVLKSGIDAEVIGRIIGVVRRLG